MVAVRLVIGFDAAVYMRGIFYEYRLAVFAAPAEARIIGVGRFRAVLVGDFYFDGLGRQTDLGGITHIYFAVDQHIAADDLSAVGHEQSTDSGDNAIPG